MAKAEAGSRGTSDISDSVYREAVHRLRVLLSASEQVANLDQVENRPNSQGIGVARGISGSADQLDISSRREGLFNKLPPRQPQSGGVRKLIFPTSSSGVGEGRMERARHNSWHSLTQVGREVPSPKTPGPSQTVRELIHRQDKYVEQLEAETKFCRHQLANILSQVKDLFMKNNQSNKNDNTKSIESILNALKSVEANLKVKGKRDYIPEYQKEQTTSRMEENSKLIEKMQRELAVLKQQEAEAAEQVQKSVEIAEHLSKQKHQLEIEAGHMQATVERQQVKIRSLIAEQVTKIEEEKTLVEKRYKDQISNLKKDVNTGLEEIGSLTAQLDKSTRLVNEVKKQLSDKDNMIRQIREDEEKRVGILQLELVSTGTEKQAAERELNACKLQLERATAEYKNEVNRLESEVSAVRSRLKIAEEQVLASRRELVEMAEKSAGLERDASNNKYAKEQSEKRRICDLEKIREKSFEDEENLRTELLMKEKRWKKEVGDLENMVQRQSSIIGELKSQCYEVTERFEDAHNKWKAERDDMRRDIYNLDIKLKEAHDVNLAKENQFVQHANLYEKLMRRLEEQDEDKQTRDQYVRTNICEKDSNKKDGLMQELKIRNSIGYRGVRKEHIGRHNIEHMNQEIKGSIRKRNDFPPAAITIERDNAIKEVRFPKRK